MQVEDLKEKTQSIAQGRSNFVDRTSKIISIALFSLIHKCGITRMRSSLLVLCVYRPNISFASHFRALNDYVRLLSIQRVMALHHVSHASFMYDEWEKVLCLCSISFLPLASSPYWRLPVVVHRMSPIIPSGRASVVHVGIWNLSVDPSRPHV
jgi:hypothetical protein